MKRLVTFSLIITLVFSLAAPSGAAFAISGGVQADAPSLENDANIATNPETADHGASAGEAAVSDIQGEIDTVEVTEVGSVDAAQAGSESVSNDTDGVSAGSSATPVSPPAEETALGGSPSISSGKTPIVIAQIQVGVSGNARDEYVSLYNNNDEVVDVTGWCVRNKSGVKFACVEGDTDVYMQPRSYISFSVIVRDDKAALALPMRTCGGSSGCIVGSSDTIQLVTKADVVVNEIAWTNNSSSRYAIERKWDTGQAHRFMTGKDSDSWEIKTRLAHYGYVDELIECADGALVLNEAECPAPIPETPKLPALPIEITEVLPNPKGADEGKEFIELYNPNDEAVDLSQWRIYVNGDYDTAYAFAPGTTIEAEEHLVVKQDVVKFTLKNSVGSVRLESPGGVYIVDVPTWNNAKDDKAWALIDGVWQYADPSPGEENSAQRDDVVKVTTGADCGEGRERNPLTGRCRNIPTAKELTPCKDGQYRSEETGRCRSIALAGDTLKPCKEGQYRSEETNRCRSIASAAASVLKPCRDDQFRNPETGRCKKIASADELADCGEGRERNPVTNRCRNVIATAAPTVGFSPQPVHQVAGATWGWWVFGGVSMVALGYAGWQWRWELKQAALRVRSMFTHGGK